MIKKNQKRYFFRSKDTPLFKCQDTNRMCSPRKTVIKTIPMNKLYQTLFLTVVATSFQINLNALPFSTDTQQVDLINNLIPQILKHGTIDEGSPRAERLTPIYKKTPIVPATVSKKFFKIFPPTREFRDFQGLTKKEKGYCIAAASVFLSESQLEHEKIRGEIDGPTLHAYKQLFTILVELGQREYTESEAPASITMVDTPRKRRQTLPPASKKTYTQMIMECLAYCWPR